MAIRGTCGHTWLDFACYAVGSLNQTEHRAVDAQSAACATCFEELTACVEMAALLYEAFAAERQRQRVCREWWPPRGRR
jgi:anti-sigma factor RsiW